MEPKKLITSDDKSKGRVPPPHALGTTTIISIPDDVLFALNTPMPAAFYESPALLALSPNNSDNIIS